MDALVALGAIIVAAAIAYFRARLHGDTKRKLDAAKEDVEAHETRDEVENRIARERDAHERLRDKWGR